MIPGPAAAQSAGPAIVLSFLIAALGCALAGLCYAELAAMCPAAGSAYTYTTQAFGRLRWLIGWLLVLEYSFAAGIITQSCGTYAAGLFPTPGLPFTRAVASGISLLVLIAITALKGEAFSARTLIFARAWSHSCRAGISRLRSGR